jgi:hypothetical protein
MEKKRIEDVAEMDILLVARGSADAASKFCDVVRGSLHDLTKLALDRSFRQLFQGNYEKIHIPISC